MTEIVTCINELKSIETELKSLRTKMKPLFKRKKELESVIIDYLGKNGDSNGIKYRDCTVVAENKLKTQRLKKADRLEKTKTFLKKHGVSTNETVVNDLINTLKGDTKTTKVVKLKT